jgi:hypothetical protein
VVETIDPEPAINEAEIDLVEAGLGMRTPDERPSNRRRYDAVSRLPLMGAVSDIDLAPQIYRAQISSPIGRGRGPPKAGR